MASIIKFVYNANELKQAKSNYSRLFDLLDEKTGFVSETVTNRLYKEKRFFKETLKKEACFCLKGTNPLIRFFLTIDNRCYSNILSLEMDDNMKYLDSKFRKKAKDICETIKSRIDK